MEESTNGAIFHLLPFLVLMFPVTEVKKHTSHKSQLFVFADYFKVHCSRRRVAKHLFFYVGKPRAFKNNNTLTALCLSDKLVLIIRMPSDVYTQAEILSCKASIHLGESMLRNLRLDHIHWPESCKQNH